MDLQKIVSFMFGDICFDYVYCNDIFVLYLCLNALQDDKANGHM